MPLENNTSTSTAANLPIYMVRLEQISEIKDQERILLGRLLALTKGGENASCFFTDAQAKKDLRPHREDTAMPANSSQA